MKFNLLLCLLLLTAFKSAHPLKMSVCDVKYHADKSYLTLKFKFFLDDLEAVLEKRSGKNLTLGQPGSENDQALAIFINQYFQLSINGQPVVPRLYRSYPQEVMLVVECMGEGFRAAPVYHIDLSNQLLLDIFPDQYNLVRFDLWGDGNLETFRFEKSERRLVRDLQR